MLDPKRECVDQAQSLLRTYFIELFFQLTSSPERYKTLISVFFLPKNGYSIVNFKWFRGVCVSTINSTTIKKFENEKTATKRIVFLSELCDC